jgi:PAS domain S-box-containing protein
MSLLRDDDDQPIGILGVTRDITERKQAEETPRASGDEYRDLFENASDMIQSIDADGKFIYVNRSWLEVMGFSREELKDMRFTDILRQDQAPIAMEVMQGVLHGEKYDQGWPRDLCGG